MNRRLLRYLIIGGTAFGIELACIYILKNGLGLTSVQSVAVSFWIGLIVSFLMQKYLVFGNRERHRRAITRQVAAYGTLVLWNYVFTLGITHLLANVLSVYILRGLTMGIIICWNYLIYAHIFKSSPPHAPSSKTTTSDDKGSKA